MGRTGRSLYQRYKEHYIDFKNGDHRSNFAKHLLDSNHSIGPITNIMEVLHVTKKREHMKTLEKLRIYMETKNEN
jgi:hypothetical protein